jgi:hypothetical protein
MSGNLLEGMFGATTQTIDSGKALAKFLGMKEEVPETIGLANGARLVLSSKHDAYYMVTSKGCTCRAGQYGRMCKHRRALESSKTTPTRVFAKPSTSFNLPEEDEKRVASSPCVVKMLIDAYAFDTKPGEIAYWQAKQQAAAQET